MDPGELRRGLCRGLEAHLVHTGDLGQVLLVLYMQPLKRSLPVHTVDIGNWGFVASLLILGLYFIVQDPKG